jgi:hypothetical protein
MSIKVGDVVTVRKDSFIRGGQSGTVVDVLSRYEVAIDFFCDVFGDPKGLPSIEAWKTYELELID